METTTWKRALVVGLGIAGMSAALGLQKAGWEPVIIERSPERRTGGYFIGLSGEAFEAANYFGISHALVTRTPADYTTWEIDRNGKKHKGMRFTDQPNHPEVVLRGDIEEGLWAGVVGQIEVRFNTTTVAIGSNPDEAVVRLRNNATGVISDEVFDLVVGADGLRSTVRNQVFGPNDDYLKPMDALICAFQLTEQVPGVNPHDGLIVAEEDRSLWIFPFADRPPTALFTYRPHDVDAQFSMSHRDALHQAFAGMSGNGAVQHCLDQFDLAPDYLFDSVHTVEMTRWHHNRVVLLGDAAWCLTLYSGMGATSAMHGGAVLGKVLTEQDDVTTALTIREAEMRPFIEKKGKLTWLKAQLFVPSNQFAYRVRSVVLTSGVIPKVRSAMQRRTEARARLHDRLFGERVAA